MTSEQAAARAGLYRLLAIAFDYPRSELFDAIQSGEYQQALSSCVRIIGISVDELPNCETSREELEATYLQTFEHGRNGDKPCVLREGAHVHFELEDECSDIGAGPPGLMEDLLRFYHYFGLKLSEDPVQKLPPDHIVCQLEMLSHLSFLESKKNPDDEIASGYRDAQRDFLRRHVVTWLPKVHEELKMAANKDDAPPGFYTAIANVANAGVSVHLDCVS